MYVLGVIVLAILFEKVIGNVNSIWYYVESIINIFVSIFKPFIYGFFIAFCLHPLVNWLETKVFSKIKFFRDNNRLRRTVALVVTYLMFIGLLVWLIAYLVPEIIENTKRLIGSVTANIPQIQLMLENLAEQLDFIPDNTIDIVLDTLTKPLWLTSSNFTSFINKIILSTVGVAYGLLNGILGIMISFYMLSNKETFARQINKLVLVLFDDRISSKIITIAKESNYYFEKFIIGKAIDSMIIGIICCACLSIFKVQYALIISLIVGVTNMIPYFGPFIGGVPAVIITLISTGPIQALWMVLFIFVLQQFDGIVLGPKILGDTIGLQPFWIIFSIIVGGSLFGVVGMFLGVPLFAVINAIVSRVVNRKYNEKIQLGEEGLRNE